MDTRERTLAGRYRLKQVVGRGGMSTVYRAADEVLGHGGPGGGHGGPGGGHGGPGG